MVEQVVSTIAQWISRWGYLGVFISAVGVLPAEIVMTIVGAVRPEIISLVKIALSGALGEVLGAWLTYLLGYYFRNKDIIGYLNGKGKWLNVDEASFMKSHESFKHRGFLYIFLTRFTPGVRVVVLLVAGYLKHSIIWTSIAVFIGTFIYAFGFAYLGSRIGFNLEKIGNAINFVNNGLVILTILTIGVIGYMNRGKIRNLVIGKK